MSENNNKDSLNDISDQMKNIEMIINKSDIKKILNNDVLVLEKKEQNIEMLSNLKKNLAKNFCRLEDSNIISKSNTNEIKDEINSEKNNEIKLETSTKLKKLELENIKNDLIRILERINELMSSF
ncbi:hypothetical protein [Lyticum sinuosum]|uniref:Uncharacterized protein n=1 Tax=Lyticum sinuosum TaxID=1332059 RepID=A0AAE4VKI0_9RICK|nr:hypothetical protein [Lyticum sinuosum]MDZ5760889.1 hypothetical protein [Lyticum sinuosum]